MSPFTLLIVVIILVIIALIVRKIARLFRRPNFPVRSICLLSAALLLLVASTIYILLVNQAIGGAMATVASFLGLLESRLRHGEEARH